MPPSVKFVLAMLGAAALAAPVAIYVQYRETEAVTQTTAEQITGGNADRGRVAIIRYGCGGCHNITGIAGADGKVGPSLAGVALRAVIAGKLANQPANMVSWLQHPQAIVPGNAMPDENVSEQDARDIAAYLYTLRGIE